jgi:23S rRNA (pseudouridine1915-N3)-methyltransferase
MTYVFHAPKPKGFFGDACKEYEKRLGRHCKMEYESPGAGYNVLISPQGKAMSSEELASRISALSLTNRRIDFFFGESNPLCNESWLLFSCGASLPCQIAALQEQIYRACKINGGEPYHK